MSKMGMIESEDVPRGGSACMYALNTSIVAQEMIIFKGWETSDPQGNNLHPNRPWPMVLFGKPPEVKKIQTDGHMVI